MLTPTEQVHVVYRDQLLGKINYVIESADN